MRIQNNITAQYAHRQLLNNNKNLSVHIERLSSGYRINKSADDAAGLAISQKLTTQVRGLRQAQKNIQEGISLLQTTDGALNNVTDTLHKMNTLAVQAANDTLSNKDRSMIQTEINQLLSHIDITTSSANFNQVNLLRNNTTASGRILYSSDPLGNQDIYSINSDGTDEVQITNDPKNEFNAVLSPDGNKIVFTKDSTFGNSEIFVMNADGSNVTQLTNNPGTSSVGARWSPDGSKLIFSSTIDGNWDIFIMNADGSNWNKIYDSGSNDSISSISPAGNKILFQSDSSGNEDIYTMNWDGSNVTNLTNNVALDIGAEYSPDGNKILFLSDRAFWTDFYTMNPDGTGVTRLTTHIDNDGMGATWSPDGSQIALIRGAERQLYVMNADGSNLTKITNGSNKKLPSWDSIIINNDNTVNIQAGANANENIEIERKNIQTITLGLSNLNITSVSDANCSIEKIQYAINTVSNTRAYFGATQNRLEHAMNFAGIAEENQQAAESRIRDADYASEMMEYTKNQILTQAAQSMLSQANMRPQNVLQMLG